MCIYIYIYILKYACHVTDLHMHVFKVDISTELVSRHINTKRFGSWQ